MSPAGEKAIFMFNLNTLESFGNTARIQLLREKDEKPSARSAPEKKAGNSPGPLGLSKDCPPAPLRDRQGHSGSNKKVHN